MTDVKKVLDDFVKNSDLFLASPDTFEQMSKKGLPVSKKVQSYSDYLDELFKKRREEADERVKSIPLLRETIVNAAITSLYEEFKECFVMGINGASIVMSILLLDLAAKYKLHEARKAKNDKASWKPIEDMHLGEVIKELRIHKAISEDEEQSLLAFNSQIRNNHLHYNIQKLVKDIIAEQLPSVNVETGEVTVEFNVRPAERPHLWFFAKRVLDKETLVDRTSYCINWVNKLLG
jgi:hypothetical protein